MGRPKKQKRSAWKECHVKVERRKALRRHGRPAVFLSTAGRLAAFLKAPHPAPRGATAVPHRPDLALGDDILRGTLDLPRKL
jgi:hypothetical protein